MVPRSTIKSGKIELPPRNTDKNLRELSPLQRKQGQHRALLSNLFGGLINYIVQGAIMMLFANDVLRLSPRRIASVIAIAPLLSIIRFVLIGPIQKIGYIRIILLSSGIQVLLIAALIVLPVHLLSFPLFLSFMLLFMASSQLGTGVVWQPLLRDITTNDDRGQFFSRMRFTFSSFTTLTTISIPFLIGQQITEWQYKILLCVALLGTINRMLWVRRIPTIHLPNSTQQQKQTFSLKAIWNVARTSRLLRLPLLISILVSIVAFPLYVVYLKQLLHIPSNIISIMLFTTALGTSLSFLIWGKIADAIGYRPMLTGLIIIFIAAIPLELFIAPLPSSWGGIDAMDIQNLITIGLILLKGFLNGAILAGIGISTTSINHYYVNRNDSLIAMNIYSFILLVINSLLSLSAGFLMQDIALPAGSQSFFNNLLHFDWVKGFHFFIVAPFQIIALILLHKLPNTRSYFGLSDFFSSITPSTMWHLLSRQSLLHEHEDKRAQMAFRFGMNTSPVSIQPLTEMLNDPSYDVVVAAIRTLAQTRNALAGEKLLTMLQRKTSDSLTHHLIWALGELEYTPALDEIIHYLDPSFSDHNRMIAARALGKLHELNAIPPIVETLQKEQQSAIVISSCCRALLRLHADNYMHLVFDALATMGDHDGKYELCDVLCTYMGFSNDWLIRYNGDKIAYFALQEYVQNNPQHWSDEQQLCIDAFLKKDDIQIRFLLNKEKKDDTSMIFGQFYEAIGRTKSWNALFVLSTAWFLFRK